MRITDRLKMGEYDYDNLPKCQSCPINKKREERVKCALYWRPGTGTKAGFPKDDGWECPRDSVPKELGERE